MREDLVPLLRCPGCLTEGLHLTADEHDAHGIQNGVLACGSCRAVFRVSEGIPNLLTSSSSNQWAEEQKAMQAAWCDSGVGGLDPSWDPSDVEKSLLALPEGEEGGLFAEEGLFRNLRASAVGFVSVLEMMDLRGGEMILDVGAGTCYTTREFAKRDCRAVAIEVWPDCLRQGRVFIERENIHFERALADMNQLPFRDGTFDVIFANQSIHHCENLADMFRELRRTLRPEGRVFMIEPIVGLLDFAGRRAVRQSEAAQMGVNEHTYSGLEYWRAARRAGMKLQFVLLRSAIDKKLSDPSVIEKYRGIHHRFFLGLMRRPLLRRLLLDVATPALVALRPFSVAMICRV